MAVLITLSLLFVASLALAALRLMRRSASFAWLAATLGALLAWGSLPFWQFDLPARIALSVWSPATLFNASPDLLADSYAWLYAFSLAALAAAVILTSPARIAVLSPVSWIASLMLAVVASLAVMADNLLTLVLAWTAVDILEFINTLRSSETPALSERAAVSFAFRAIGTGLALWASVISASSGQLGTLETMPPPARLFMLLAIGLRLGVLPLHLAYRNDPSLRRGFGTTLRLTAAATSLVVLARLPAGLVEPSLLPYLLAFTAVAALYASWKWLSLPDEISARPYWIIGMSALSLAAALRGSPAGSAAWGVALILFGGLLFLYSARQVWFTRFFAALALLLLALPFTLTASGWTGDFPLPWLFWPLFMATHAMLVAGYIRHLFHAGEAQFAELPRWAQAAYPVGLGTFVVTLILSGLWGWPGAQQIGNWIAGLVMVALAGATVAIFLRLRKTFGAQPPVPPEPGDSRFVQMQEFFVGLFWGTYRLLGRVMGYLSNLLEGDGGLLWTLLLLVLFITLLRGR